MASTSRVSVSLSPAVQAVSGLPAQFFAQQLSLPYWNPLSQHFVVQIRYNGVVYYVDESCTS